MRILLLTSFDVFPPVHGGSSIVYNFMKHAATRHEVSALISHLYSLDGSAPPSTKSRQPSGGARLGVADLTDDNVHIEHYQPSLSDRKSREEWSEDGRKVTWERAADTVQRLLADHNYSLPVATRQQVLSVIPGIVD